MNKIRFLIPLFLLVTLSLARAQDSKAPTASEIEANQNVEELQLLREKAAQAFEKDPGSAIQFCEEIINKTEDLAKKNPIRINDLKRVKVDMQVMLGRIHEKTGNEEAAEKQFSNALSNAEEINYAKGRLLAIRNIQMLSEEEELAEDLTEDGTGEGSESPSRKTSRAIRNLEKSALAYEERNRPDRSVEKLLEVADLLKENRDSLNLTKTYHEIARLEQMQGHIKQAMYYNGLASIANGTLDAGILPESPDQVDQFLNNMDKLVSRLSNVKLISTDEEIQAKKKKDNYEEMASSYEQQGDYKKALEIYKDYFDLKEQLIASERLRELDSIESGTLKDRNDLLERQKKLQQRDLEMKDWELNRSRIFLIGSIVGSLLLIMVAASIFRLFLVKKRSHRALEEAHRELKSAQIQLVEAEKMASIGQLTAGIAHEINNPINFVSANITPLKRDIDDVMEILDSYGATVEANRLSESFSGVEALKQQLDLDFLKEEIASLLAGIEDGASRTAEIVRGLRNFSRLDENDLKLFDVHEGLDSTLAILQSRFANRIEIVKEYGELPEIEGFPGKLNQVFMNLLVNAEQAIPEHGMITITTGKEGEEVWIRIRDTGKGMPEEVRKRIFEPFFTTKDVGGGTGLGLSISFGIIENHGGKISVESEPEAGTEFMIRLPIKAQR
jgi:signal transduction histidine kinase